MIVANTHDFYHYFAISSNARTQTPRKSTSCGVGSNQTANQDVNDRQVLKIRNEPSVHQANHSSHYAFWESLSISVHCVCTGYRVRMGV